MLFQNLIRWNWNLQRWFEEISALSKSTRWYFLGWIYSISILCSLGTFEQYFLVAFALPLLPSERGQATEGRMKWVDCDNLKNPTSYASEGQFFLERGWTKTSFKGEKSELLRWRWGDSKWTFWGPRVGGFIKNALWNGPVFTIPKRSLAELPRIWFLYYGRFDYIWLHELPRTSSFFLGFAAAFLASMGWWKIHRNIARMARPFRQGPFFKGSWFYCQQDNKRPSGI